MDGDEPAGGRWNFDRDNREPPPAEARPPKPYRPREDLIDRELRRDLEQMELDCFGHDARLWPATRRKLRALERFARPAGGLRALQDAMLAGERFMWHSHLSSSLNLGLLQPLEVAERAERAYREGEAPIAASRASCAGDRLARVRLGHLLARPAGLARVNALAARRAARGALERGHGHALRGRSRWPASRRPATRTTSSA